MALTRDQIKSANDLTMEPLFIPEWLPTDKRSRCVELERQIASSNGSTPNDLLQEYESIRQESTCYISMISAADCERLQQAAIKDSGNRQSKQTHFFARLAIATVRDSDGKRLFDDADIAWLSGKSFRALNRIANAALSLNGMTKADQDELLKNSDQASD